MGCGTVGDILDCLHECTVPTLENDLLSVPHIHVAMGWRSTFGKGKWVIEGVSTGTVKYSGVFDRGIMLYVVPVSQVLGLILIQRPWIRWKPGNKLSLS